MISDFNIAKSCKQKLDDYADANSYYVVAEGKTYEPSTDEVYLKEFAIFNDVDQGLANSASQEQRPIYQVNICIPAEYSKFSALAIKDAIRAHFERGADITLDATQQVIIQNTSLTTLEADSTHNIYAMSINLTVYG